MAPEVTSSSSQTRGNCSIFTPLNLSKAFDTALCDKSRHHRGENKPSNTAAQDWFHSFFFKCCSYCNAAHLWCSKWVNLLHLLLCWQDYIFSPPCFLLCFHFSGYINSKCYNLMESVPNMVIHRKTTKTLAFLYYLVQDKSFTINLYVNFYLKCLSSCFYTATLLRKFSPSSSIWSNLD